MSTENSKEHKEFKPITSQEELDAVIGERLKRQKESLESKFNEELSGKDEAYNTLKSRIDELESDLTKANEDVNKYKSDAEGYNTQIFNLTKEVEGNKLSMLKTSIALEYGLPHSIANRLVGNDEDSIRNDAKELSSLIPSQPATSPLKDTETSVNSDDGAYKSLLDNMNLND